MHLKNTLKKIWYSLYPSGRVAVYDYPTDLKRYYTEKGNPHASLYKLIAQNKNAYRQLLKDTLVFKDAFAKIKEDKFNTDETAPGWNNGHLPGLDIILLYSLLAKLKPSQYVEIGSGTSTKTAFQSKKDNSLSVFITAIDPAPRKNINAVADKVIPQKIQDADLSLFEALQENDIVFFDGTHTLLPNSDVQWFFLEILPRLKKGVIVQVHDIYLPYDYPDFMVERYYNEQYLLGALLLANPEKYEIISPNYFMYTEKDLLEILDPIWQLPALAQVEHHGGSFWFRTR